MYYKVVCEIDNILNSAVVSSDNKFNVIYKIGEFVYPNVKYTKLCVFDSLKSAQNFIGNNKSSSIKIFSCEIINPTTDYRLLQTLMGFIIGPNRVSPPSGTIFCDAVKLLEEI